jgi:hypothetical protein
VNINALKGEMFAVWQLSEILRCNRQHIIDLVEQGELVAFDLRGAGSSRATLRIPRDSVKSFLATTSKLRSKRARISPTSSRRYPQPADALMTILRPQ